MARATQQTWNHIFSLMAAIVVSDDCIRQDEVDSFIKNARIMARELNQDRDLSEDLLIRWFHAKRDEILEQITDGRADTFIVENIVGLEPFASKQTLLNCLISIAASDAEIHFKEADLINLAAVYWDLTPIKSHRI